MTVVTDAVERPTTRPISSASKVLALLDAVGESRHPVRVSDLARRVGAPRAEVHRQLVTLVTAGWMERDADGSYRLSLKPLYVGQAALAQAGIGDRLLPIMERLMREVNEAVSLAVLDGAGARIVQRVEPGRLLRAAVAIGNPLELRTSASGRVLLAFISPDVVARLRSEGVPVPSDDDLAAIRTAGIASSIEDEEDHVTALAVPVRFPEWGSVAALSVVGPVGRFDREAVRQALVVAAAEMDRLLAGEGNGQVNGRERAGE